MTPKKYNHIQINSKCYKPPLYLQYNFQYIYFFQRCITICEMAAFQLKNQERHCFFFFFSIIFISIFLRGLKICEIATLKPIKFKNTFSYEGFLLCLRHMMNKKCPLIVGVQRHEYPITNWYHNLSFVALGRSYCVQGQRIIKQLDQLKYILPNQCFVFLLQRFMCFFTSRQGSLGLPGSQKKIKKLL